MWAIGNMAQDFQEKTHQQEWLLKESSQTFEHFNFLQL
jgi:hypothetical protein